MRNPLDTMRIRRGLVNHTFGRVRNNGTRAHQGWDLYAPIGTQIFAVAAGNVQFAHREPRGDYGRQICISFQDPRTTEKSIIYAFYGHLSQVDVVSGEVTEGMVLGLTGTSGNARGMTGEDEHLHFEFRTEPTPGLGLVGRIDPAEFYGAPPL